MSQIGERPSVSRFRISSSQFASRNEQSILFSHRLEPMSRIMNEHFFEARLGERDRADVLGECLHELRDELVSPSALDAHFAINNRWSNIEAPGESGGQVGGAGAF